MDRYGLFNILKRGFFWRWRNNSKYRNFWVYYIFAIFNIIGGFISLFIIPFGYECNLNGSIAEWSLRRTLKIVRDSKKLLLRANEIKEN